MADTTAPNIGAWQGDSNHGTTAPNIGAWQGGYDTATGWAHDRDGVANASIAEIDSVSKADIAEVDGVS